MRTLFLLVAILAQFKIAGQTFHQITALSGGQTIGGKTVTVTALGGSGSGSGTPCGMVTHKFGNGNNQPGGYLFSFSAPIYQFRMIFSSLDGPSTTCTNKGDEANLWINGTPYTIGASQVSTRPADCGMLTNYLLNDLPTIVNGKLTGACNTSLANTWIYLDIANVGAINSIQMTDTSNSSGIFFANIYFADTGITLQQPYTDTLKCPGDSLYFAYTAYTPFNTGNIFTAQLSNASGSFASPTNIGMLGASVGGTVPCKLPQNLPAGNGYKLRIVSSNPVRISDTSRNITVYNGPSSIPIASSNAPICAGQTLNLASSNAGAGVSYSWTGPGSYSAGTQNPSITNTTTAHSGDYIVTAGIGSCSRKDTVTVLVKPIPATPTAGNNGPVCSGQDLNLTASSSTSGVSYNWTGPASFSTTTQNPTRSNSTTAMSGSYSVTATLNGCTSPAGTTNATVNQSPATPTAGSNSPVCAGAAINLTANSTTSGVSYTWTGPGGFNDNNQNPTINAATIANAGEIA